MNDLFDWHIMRHLDSAYNVAYWYMGNRADAEDAVQDATISAYKAFRDFRGENARAWLLQIVRNRCLRLLESKGRYAQITEEEVVQMPSAESCNDPEASLATRIRGEVLREELAALPDPLREVIVLREFEDLTYAEIAGIIAAPAGTVMSRLSRARAMLLARIKARPEGVGL